MSSIALTGMVIMSSLQCARSMKPLPVPPPGGLTPINVPDPGAGRPIKTCKYCDRSALRDPTSDTVIAEHEIRCAKEFKKCKWCKYQSRTIRKVRKHQRTCDSNPAVIEAKEKRDRVDMVDLRTSKIEKNDAWPDTDDKKRDRLRTDQMKLAQQIMGEGNGGWPDKYNPDKVCAWNLEAMFKGGVPADVYTTDIDFYPNVEAWARDQPLPDCPLPLCEGKTTIRKLSGYNANQPHVGFFCQNNDCALTQHPDYKLEGIECPKRALEAPTVNPDGSGSNPHKLRFQSYTTINEGTSSEDYVPVSKWVCDCKQVLTEDHWVEAAELYTAPYCYDTASESETGSEI